MSSPPPAALATGDDLQVTDTFFAPDGARERSGSVSSSTSEQFSLFKQEPQPEPTPPHFAFQHAPQYSRQPQSATLARSASALLRTPDASSMTYVSPFSRPGPRIQARDQTTFTLAPRGRDSTSRPDITSPMTQVRSSADHVGGTGPPVSRDASPHVASASTPRSRRSVEHNQNPRPTATRSTESHRVQRDEDVIELMWKKVKERERELELKDEELQQMSQQLLVLEQQVQSAEGNLVQLRARSKEALAQSVKKLEDMRAEIDHLRRAADEVLPFAEGVQDSLHELAALKQNIRDALKEVAPLVGSGEDALERQVYQTKAIIHELQDKLASRLQLTDVLRDQAESAKLEAEEARGKMMQMHEAHVQAQSLEQQRIQQLGELGAQVSSLAVALSEETAKATTFKASAERTEDAYHSLIKAFEEKTNKIEEGDRRIQTLEGELGNAKIDLAAADARGEALATQLAEHALLREQYLACKESLSAAHADLERGRKDAAVHQSIESQWANDRTNAQDELHKLKFECDRLQVLLQDSAKETARLQTRLEQSLHSVDLEGKKRSDLEQELRAMQSQLDGERQRILELNGKVDERDSQVVQASKERDRNVAAVVALEQSLKDRADRHEEVVTQLVAAREIMEAISKASAVQTYELEKSVVERANLEKRIDDLRQLVETSEKRIAASTSQSQSLQERLDERTTHLKLVQEELAANAETHSRTLAELRAQMLSGDALREGISRLDEQLSSTRAAHQQAALATEVAHLDSRAKDATIEQLRNQVFRLEDELSTMKRALEEIHSNNQTLRADVSAKDALSKQTLANRDERSALQAQIWRAEKTRFEKQVQMLEQRAVELVDHLAKAQAAAASIPSSTPSREQVDRIRSLESELANAISRVEAAESESQKLRTGLGTLADRYDKNTLTAEERALVGHIAKDSRSLYERELVMKANEMRDNMIQELQDRNRSLESHIADIVKTQAPSDELVSHVLAVDGDASAASAPLVDLAQVPAVLEFQLAPRTPLVEHQFSTLNGNVSSPLSNPGPSPTSSQEMPPAPVVRKRTAPVSAMRGADSQPAKKARVQFAQGQEKSKKAETTKTKPGMATSQGGHSKTTRRKRQVNGDDN